MKSFMVANCETGGNMTVGDRARSRFRLLSETLGENQGQTNTWINGDFFFIKKGMWIRGQIIGDICHLLF